MGRGGQLPPRLENWLQSIIKYYLFIAASYWAIMNLPAPLSCFSRGFARPTSSSVICACANLCRAKKKTDRPEWVLRPWYNMLFQHVHFWKYIGYLKMTSLECHDFRMLVPIWDRINCKCWIFVDWNVQETILCIYLQFSEHSAWFPVKGSSLIFDGWLRGSQ